MGHKAERGLAKKVILITGASSGIGLEAARHLAARGAHVVLAARTLAPMEAAAAAIRAAGGQATSVALDVTDEASVTAAVARLEREVGAIDIVVNNAGNGGELGAWESHEPDHFRRTFDVHVMGMERVARAVLPAMRARGRGMIVNVASTIAWVPMPFAAAYSAAKAAVVAFSEAVRGELRGSGVEVRVFSPPHTSTAAGNRWPLRGPVVFTPEAVADQLARFLVKRRWWFVTGFSNRLLLVIRRISPGYARTIIHSIGKGAVTRKATAPSS